MNAGCVQPLQPEILRMGADTKCIANALQFAFVEIGSLKLYDAGGVKAVEPLQIVLA